MAEIFQNFPRKKWPYFEELFKNRGISEHGDFTRRARGPPDAGAAFPQLRRRLGISWRLPRIHTATHARTHAPSSCNSAYTFQESTRRIINSRLVRQGLSVVAPRSRISGEFRRLLTRRQSKYNVPFARTSSAKCRAINVSRILSSIEKSRGQ